MTREELESRFSKYIQEGEAFCALAKIRYQDLFGNEALGTNVLVREYGRGLKELLKLYHAIGDHLDEIKTFESKAKSDHEEIMEGLRIKQEVLDAAKRDYEEKAVSNTKLTEEFSKLSTMVGRLELQSNKLTTKLQESVTTDISTISTKVQTIHDDQATKDKLHAELESANRTILEKIEAVDYLEEQLQAATIRCTDLDQQIMTMGLDLSSKTSRINQLERELVEALAQNEILRGTINNKEQERDSFKSTIMERIPNLTDKHLGQPLHRALSLRTITIHPGIWIRDGEESSSPTDQSLEVERRNFNAQGFDIAITLLRFLKTMGYDVDTKRPLKRIEEVILEVLEKDVGFDETIDWQIKRHLYETMDHRNSSGLCQNWSFRDLSYHTNLQNLFEQNAQFQLFSTVSFTRTNGGPWHLSPLDHDSEEFRRINRLGCTSDRPLADQLWGGFLWKDDDEEHQYVSTRPKFLRVPYKVRTSRPFSELRNLSLRAPEAQIVDGSWRFGTQHAEYHLCAVVRLGEMGDLPGQERIRVYHQDGAEIKPSEVGAYWNKPPYGQLQWTISEPGSYMLFYYAPLCPEGWPRGPDVAAGEPEFSNED